MHHDKTHLAFVDALSALSTAVLNEAEQNGGERLHLLATACAFIYYTITATPPGSRRSMYLHPLLAHCVKIGPRKHIGIRKGFIETSPLKLRFVLFCFFVLPLIHLKQILLIIAM